MHKIWQRLTFILLFTVLTRPVSSQVQNGQFAGLVTDPTQATIVGARVTVRNLDTDFRLNLRTNDAGLFVVTELPVGRYQITVEATGFKVANSSELTLNAGTSVRVDFQLTLGPHSESLEVTSSPATVNTENPRLSETVDSMQIANLPLNGRNVYDLIQYAPGATNVRGVIFENGANTVVNGVRENFNGFLINGVSNKGLSGGPVNQPIQDSIQEFQLLTLNNSAEFGNSAGAITNLVTKSGTNFFHGSLWEYLRNNVFDANPFFVNHQPDPASRKQAPLRLNQFGGTFGGPIHKNKLFFFGAYQGDRFLTSSPGEVGIESPKFRQAVQSAFPDSIAALLYSSFPPNAPSSGIRSVFSNGQPWVTLRNYLQAFAPFTPSGFTSLADYLCPDHTDTTGAMAAKFARLFGVEQADMDQMNQGGCPSGSPFSAPIAGAFNRDEPFEMIVLNVSQSQVSGNLFDGNEASFRLDYDASEKNRFFAQFNWARSGDKFVNAAVRPGTTTPSKLTTPSFQFSYIHLFSPTLLNEFRAGYTGNLNSTTVEFPGVPNVLFDDNTVGFGAYSGYPAIFREHVYSYSDLASISQGKHSLKIGVDTRRNLEKTVANAGRPFYEFFDPLFFAIDAPYLQHAGVDPEFISGRPAQLAPNTRHFRNWEFGFFVQDDWKVFRRLTVNLGLRYDLYSRHTELDRLATTFIKGPGNGFIDNITTGAGQIRDASTPCPNNPRAVLAGACGPGGFAPAKTLGAGDHNNFGPRLGFAWDVFGNGKTALRGGAGISYEGTLYNPLSNSRWNPPYYSDNEVQNFLAVPFSEEHVIYGPVAGGKPTFLGSAPPEQHAGSGLQATGNIVGWDPANPNLSSQLPAIVLSEGIRDPYVVNWFLGVQRELRPSLALEVNYVGTAGRKLFRAENVNRIPGGRLPQGTCVTDNFGRKLCSKIDENLNHRGLLNPNYGTLRVWENAGNSIYHALQVSLRKKLRGGWQLGGNYTFSHSIDSGSGWHNSGTTANGAAAGDGFTTDVTMPGLDRGNSTFDIRHRLTFNYVWKLPFFRQAHGTVAALLAGWQVNGIWSFQSGAHWAPFLGMGRHLEGTCDSVSFDPANCVNTGGDYNLDGVNNDRPSAVADHIHVSHDQWADGFNLPDNFFFAPCLGCVSNLGRNTFLGPGYWNVDTSIFNNFKLGERFNLQFRAEAFNLFNHTNFQVGGTLGPVNNNNLNNLLFGQAGGTFPPRNLQFGLKLLF